MGKQTESIAIILIGAGRIGKLHAHNIAHRIPGLSLQCVVEPHPDPEFMSWANSLDIPVYGDIENTLTEVAAQAALVAVPTDLHENAATAAIDVGLHVFCEKPVAPDIPAARRVVEAAASAGVTLQIGFNRRFDHNFAALRQAVLDGRVGKVEMLRITSRDPAPPGIDYIRRSGGLFMDMTIHDFDMARFLSGDEFERVHAIGSSLVDPEIGKAGDIDSAIITFRMRSGAIGSIENSRRATYGYDQRAEVLGSGGAARTSNDAPSTLVVSDTNGVHAEKPLHFFLERYDRSFVAELKSFADSIRGGGPAKVTGSDGLEAMRVAQACRISLLEDRPVALDEIE